MCAIIGWSGTMPLGLISNLFIAAEHRGRDSSGIAYRKITKINGSEVQQQNCLVKQAVPSRVFVNLNGEYLKQARNSPVGLGHTRRASHKMPINNINAHPFVYENYVYAHNGFIKNWEELNKNTDKKFPHPVTTDSMILGPFIKDLNFEPLEGSLGLIWLDNENLYCMRSKKELTTANMIWSPEKTNEPHEVTIVASTWEIIEEALQKLKNVKYDAEEKKLEENTLYSIKVNGPVNEGVLQVNKNNFVDLVSSKVD